MSPALSLSQTTARVALTLVAVGALVMSLAMTAKPVAAQTSQGTIAIFKTMCQNIGKQDVCNGRDDSLDGYHIDYNVYDTAHVVVQTIVVTLGENAQGGGNPGGGSQGRAEGDPIDPGTYVVCEEPHPNPVAYLDLDEVPLQAFPRPEPGNGGSSGGPQTETDNCIQVVVTSAGTSELKFLNQQVPEPETGSLLILKTDEGDAPLAGAEFTVEGVAGTFTTADDGTFCVQNLELGADYTVTEITAPAGYDLADPASQVLTVEVEGTCADREAGPDATFVNPLIPPPGPTLVIDKVADAEVITISEGVASPSVVTWTLSYTLTNGPVTNAVISDEVPAGFTFLDAADGGVESGGVVTWTFPTLTASGSVSFRTTVDVATISRIDPTVNTATIDSDETEPDDGSDSVTVTEEGEEGGTPTPREDTQGGNPTPTGTPLPNTALGEGVGVVGIPAALLSLLLIGSLATMAYLRLAQRR